MSIVKLHVNGAIREVDVDPATPLLYVLRNDLDLKGPHFGCGLAQCGRVHGVGQWRGHPLLRLARFGRERGDHHP